jgi:secreted PhoX family phosphatase
MNLYVLQSSRSGRRFVTRPRYRTFAMTDSIRELIEQRLSRRRVLLGGLGATSAFLAGWWNEGCSDEVIYGRSASDPTNPSTAPTSAIPETEKRPDTKASTRPLTLGFAAVPKGTADALIVPAGYTATVLFRLGDPIAPSVGEYANDGSDTGASHAKRAGDHHDGMSYFGMDESGNHDPSRSDRALLVMNHEALTPAFLHPNGPTIRGTGNAAKRSVADEVIKEINSQGVSVVEIRKTRGKWVYEKASVKNRRITAATPMDLTGPAAGSAYMITKYSPNGMKTRGTVNNCAHGHTPWGTYLTCEENWAGYFRRIAAVDDEHRTARELASFARYGVSGAGRELWSTVTPDTADDAYSRWNAQKIGTSSDGSDDYRNAPNTFGWVVEIDPFEPGSTPKKRTSLGRMAHEGCWSAPAVVGRPVAFYMGCDGRNEYIYKYVSTQKWNAADANAGIRAGGKYLDAGKLYVAKFHADGTGHWIELAYGVGDVNPSYGPYAFADQADVLINTRHAADAAGGTKMDRPEWGGVHPKTGEVYFSLTNTNATSRPMDKVDAANPRFYNDPKGPSHTEQKGNPNGHVIRIAEARGDHSATTFTWDVYIFGARATADAVNVNVSGLSGTNDFSSPDGLCFSHAAPGLMWLRTDDAAYTDVTNCMMLAAIPGRVGDGAKRTVTNVDGFITKTVETFVGQAVTESTLRRFLVGPKECEITGFAESPDGKTMFVNIQHPGEDTKPTLTDPDTFGSHWPDGGDARPRSATVAITRNDGGVVGLD